MKKRTIRAGRLALIIFIALLLSGTNKCQEDYVLLRTPSPSPTATATATATPDDDTVATPTATPNNDDEENDDDDDSDDETSTSGERSLTESLVGGGFLSGLRELSAAQREAAGRSPSRTAKGDASPQTTIPKLTSLDQLTRGGVPGAGGNWLGELYAEESQGLAELDQDGDGYSDLLEIDSGSDELDPESRPGVTRTQLKARLVQSDSDLDGLLDREEGELGAVVGVRDSDGDGFSDGSERKAGTSVVDSSDFPKDSDGDGLGDEYELRVGLNPNLVDTDGDRLDDETESIVGSDGLQKDSDRDGIFDGEEVRLGSDPTVPESRR
ncbi:MSCRAMM family adhesin SdrC [bacterium]|nr:MSCRAMM family adhesin SdrC [bacterium]